jgi:hypothetical protein
VIDTQKPAFVNPPANITVQCDAIPNPATPVATDNCDANVAITYVGQTRTNGTCTNRYTLTRRWVASDNCNNTISISQRISVVDNGKPVFTSVPGNVTLACTDPIPAVGAHRLGRLRWHSDRSRLPRPWNMNATCPGNYQIMRTWKATDACGNSTTVRRTDHHDSGQHSADIHVVPEQRDDPVQPGSTGLSNPVATDGCGGYVQITYLGQVRTNGNCLYNYTLTRTWRATDLCGNATTRAQVITVQDTQAPNFTGNLPASTTVVCAPNCVPLAPTLTATDNCGSATVTLQQTQTAGDCASGYTVTRTWTATDQCGNAKQHTQTYTVLPTPFAPGGCGVRPATAGKPARSGSCRRFVHGQCAQRRAGSERAAGFGGVGEEKKIDKGQAPRSANDAGRGALLYSGAGLRNIGFLGGGHFTECRKFPTGYTEIPAESPENAFIQKL